MHQNVVVRITMLTLFLSINISCTWPTEQYKYNIQIHIHNFYHEAPSYINKKLSYRRETARQLHTTTRAGQLTF